jgi:glycosyltransferase involved in cell wall biosynthesis
MADVATISKSSAEQNTELPRLENGKATAVCIVVENLPVPLDRRVWSEARALRDAGYLVSIICPKGKKSCRAAYELLEGIHIYRHRTWEALNSLGYLFEYLVALVAEFYLVFKVFARTRFRVLQGCNPPDNIFLIALALRPFGVRFVFDHHDLAPELFEAKFGKRYALLRMLSRVAEKLSFKVANVSIATNDSFKQIAVERGGKQPEQVFVVRNCPDLRMATLPPPRHATGQTKPLLVAYVGFMGQQDGLDILLDSIDHLVNEKKRRDANFVLIGGGSMLPALQAIVSERGLDRFVKFTGQIPHNDVLAYLSLADIGVAPDPKTPMNDKSTMIKIFEYMAFGLPIVLFDLKEGRRVAGPAALYAAPNDPVDFATQVTKLLNSNELRQRLGTCGRKRIEEGLNWDSEKMVLLRAYGAALRQNGVQKGDCERCTSVAEHVS